MRFINLFGLKLLHHGEEAGVEGTSTEPATGSQAQPEAEVVYGRPPEDIGPQNPVVAAINPSQTPPDPAAAQAEARQEAYRQFRDANKDLYEADLKTHLGQRLKGKDREISNMKSVIDPLLAYFGHNDLTQLMEFIKSDILPQVEGTEQYKLLAAKQGTTQTDGEGAAAQPEAEVTLDPAEAVAQGMQLADKLKVYGIEFELPQEMENPEFVGLLNKGLTVEQAYNAMNHDTIVLKAAQKAAAAEKKAVIDTIRAKGLNAVTETATQPARPVIYKNDPSTWTDDELMAVTKRAMNGEQISL